MMEKWTLEIGDRDYLDGIQSGHMVRADNGSPVAYMFDDARARLATAAPDLLEALLECRDAEMRRSAKLKPGAPATTYTEVRLARIDAAIARATGADQ